MKDAIALDTARTIVVEAKPGEVPITLKTYGMPIFLHPLTPDQAEAIGNALIRAAQQSKAGASA